MPFDPSKGERLAPAWKLALDRLADGEWHPWRPLVLDMLAVADIVPATANSLLYEAIKNDVMERRGEYVAKPRSDTREIRLAVKP